jgi:hypothetical protein
MSDNDVPNEMSSVLRVLHAFTTCGTKDRVVHVAAASPRIVVNVTCHTRRLRSRFANWQKVRRPSNQGASHIAGSTIQCARRTIMRGGGPGLPVRAMMQGELGLIYCGVGVIPKFTKRLISNCSTV